MTYAVSSWFIAETQKQNSRPIRRFYLGTSDYTDHILKWPSLKTRWDDPQSKTAAITATNANQELNFIRETKTNLTIAGTLTLGFETDNKFRSPNNFNDTASGGWINANAPIVVQGVADHLGTTSAQVLIDSSNTVHASLYHMVNSPNFEVNATYVFSAKIAKATMINSSYPAIRFVYSSSGGVGYNEVTDFKFRLDTGSYYIAQNSLAYNVTSLAIFSMGEYSSSWWNVQAGLPSVDSNCYRVWVQLFPAMGDVAWNTAVTATNSMTLADVRMERVDIHDEQLTLFKGKIRQVSYRDAGVEITLADKMKQLSERLIGTRESPQDYTGSNYLLSDLAWFIVTSWGGYSAVKSSSNVDIDYDEFKTWSGIMSGDNVRVRALFDGIRCTEALRKIARLSRTAIFIEQDRLVFTRFSEIVGTVGSVDGTTMIAGTLVLKDDDIINRMYVSADYSPTSSTFGITVVETSSASVNSYGLYEDAEDDKSIWYVDSTSALGLAQRIMYTNGEPADRISIDAPLNMLPYQLGDTILYTSSVQNIYDNYRIMENTVNLDKLTVKAEVDRTQVVSPFYLDITSLDGAGVLT